MKLWLINLTNAFFWIDISYLYISNISKLYFLVIAIQTTSFRICLKTQLLKLWNSTEWCAIALYPTYQILGWPILFRKMVWLQRSSNKTKPSIHKIYSNRFPFVRWNKKMTHVELLVLFSLIKTVKISSSSLTYI